MRHSILQYSKIRMNMYLAQHGIVIAVIHTYQQHVKKLAV